MAVDLKKEYAGQPGYVWLAGGLVFVGGLLYILYKSRQQGLAGSSGAAAGATDGAASPTGLTTGQLQGWIADHQGSTVTTHKTTCPKGYHWNAKQHRCVKNPAPKRRKHMPKV